MTIENLDLGAMAQFREGEEVMPISDGLGYQDWLFRCQYPLLGAWLDEEKT